MPVHKVNGGYQWGNHGKVYHGANAKEKAAKQGQAAHANGFNEDPKGPPMGTAEETCHIQAAKDAAQQ